MRLILLILVSVVVAGCESDVRPPIGRPEDGPARFEFLSSWEPAVHEGEYVNTVGYSFALKNQGGRAGAPFCEILYKGQPLPGWSEGPEIGVGTQGRVEGEALLPQGPNPTSITKLEPVCREATGHEAWTSVPKRFFAAEGDVAYFRLKERGWNIRFGPQVTPQQRQNIRGHRSHPEVVLAAVEREHGSKRLTITAVDCVGREQAIC